MASHNSTRMASDMYALGLPCALYRFEISSIRSFAALPHLVQVFGKQLADNNVDTEFTPASCKVRPYAHRTRSDTVGHGRILMPFFA